MNEPADFLFVYGSLKPHELGFEQIKNLIVNYREAEIRGYSLYVRDGLPLIKKTFEDNKVRGFLIEVNPNYRIEFWKSVDDYEGTTNYRREDGQRILIENSEILATTYVGRKMNKGNPQLLNEPWSSKLNPILSQSFPFLHLKISSNNLKFTEAEHDPSGYWRQMNDLLSQYLLLVSILEHLTVVKFGGRKGQEPMVRIGKFQDSDGFKNAFEKINQELFNPSFYVSDSRKVEDSLSSSSPDKALEAWYQVRSNLQHRGKSSIYDAGLVQKSCIGLSNLLLEYLRTEVSGIEDEWCKILGRNLNFAEYTA